MRETIAATPEEVESERLELLEEWQEDPNFEERFVKPGLGTHELVDRASLQMNMWYDYILEHPSCAAHPELFALAHQIADGIHDFYQHASCIEEDKT